jgi:hypothetical protein
MQPARSGWDRIDQRAELWSLESGHPAVPPRRFCLRGRARRFCTGRFVRLGAFRCRMRFRALGDLGHRTPGLHAGQRGLDQRVGRAGFGIVELAEQPVLGFLLAPRLEADQQPLALHPLAIQDEVEVALIDVLGRFAGDRRPGAIVPQHHRAAAIFALGDGPLEIGVGQRMVFGAHRQPLLVRVDARPARDGPAFQHAVHLEAEIPVQPRGIVLLHHEAIAVPRRERSGRLGGLREIALGVIAL